MKITFEEKGLSMTPDIQFEWEDEIQEIPDVGPCFVGYMLDDTDGQWYRIAIALSELEELAKRKLLKTEKTRH